MLPLKLKVSLPITELQGFLDITRLMMAVIGGFPYPVSRIFLATDSECMIGAIEAKDRGLQE